MNGEMVIILYIYVNGMNTNTNTNANDAVLARGKGMVGQDNEVLTTTSRRHDKYCACCNDERVDTEGEGRLRLVLYMIAETFS